MEEVFVVILQGLVEFLLEMLVYIGIDLRWKRDDGGIGCSWVSAFLLLGAGLGGITNLIHPKLLMPTPAARIAALVLGPLAGGALSWVVAGWRNRHGASLVPSNHFATAFCFVLAFDVVRYAFGSR